MEFDIKEEYYEVAFSHTVTEEDNKGKKRKRNKTTKWCVKGTSFGQVEAMCFNYMDDEGIIDGVVKSIKKTKVTEVINERDDVENVEELEFHTITIELSEENEDGKETKWKENVMIRAKDLKDALNTFIKQLKFDQTDFKLKSVKTSKVVNYYDSTDIY